MLEKKSLTAVTECPLCGSEMSTCVVCDECGGRMCMVCGQKHEHKKEEVSDDGELHPQHPES